MEPFNFIMRFTHIIVLVFVVNIPLIADGHATIHQLEDCRDRSIELDKMIQNVGNRYEELKSAESYLREKRDELTGFFTSISNSVHNSRVRRFNEINQKYISDVQQLRSYEASYDQKANNYNHDCSYFTTYSRSDLESVCQNSGGDFCKSLMMNEGLPQYAPVQY